MAPCKKCRAPISNAVKSKIQCSTCEDAYHTSCADTPTLDLEGHWYCPVCWKKTMEYSQSMSSSNSKPGPLNTQHFQQIMDQLAQLNTQISVCNQSIHNIKETLMNHSQSITDCVAEVSALKDKTTNLETQLVELQSASSRMVSPKEVDLNLFCAESRDRMEREKNIMITGIPETNCIITDENHVESIVTIIRNGYQSLITSITRIGKPTNGKTRPIKVVERANTALQGSPQTQSIAKITIESINLKVPHLTPNDDIKLQLLTRIKADESMMIPFRRWELHELPALTQGSTIEIWSVKTCSALDSPRYVIVFFQTKKADNLHEDVTLFDNANIKSIRLALNSDYYPQERMLLDFSRDQYADAHFNYTESNKSYHNCQEKRSLVNFAEFKSRPMFVIDCSRRHLGLKSSTVDINSTIKQAINVIKAKNVKLSFEQKFT
ncbi:unnamed protein product [Phaedon cochleariae]|uniref:Zinc finger PHD-type domain-containing protein n=1 Tax=Phaedon cochleariae TaxID=80249 RepID=A0A9N9WZV2_PHACE|nr:unnamed protein product [Phaedon cochleariae]